MRNAFLPGISLIIISFIIFESNKNQQRESLHYVQAASSNNRNPMHLVVGASGQVGSHLIHTLVSRGIPATAVVRDPVSATIGDYLKEV
jgi:hypothetical protein